MTSNFYGFGGCSNTKRYFLDKVKNASVAYSLRKLKKIATNCIRVRRDSDNLESDIGFAGNIIDIPSLLSFVGSGSGYLTKVYDQSGNNNHSIQSTAASQPRIVNSGVIDININALFNGTSSTMRTTASAIMNPSNTMSHLFKIAVPASNSGYKRLLTYFANSTNYLTIGLYGLLLYFAPCINNVTSQNMMASNLSTNTWYNTIFTFNNGIIGINLNNKQVALQSDTPYSLANGNTGLYLGSRQGVDTFTNVNFSEYIMFNSVLSSYEIDIYNRG